MVSGRPKGSSSRAATVSRRLPGCVIASQLLSR